MNPGMQRSTMAASLSTHQVPATSTPSALPSAGDCEAASSSQASAQRHQLALMRAGQLSAVQRVAAGNELARLGDPRFRLDAWISPMIHC